MNELAEPASDFDIEKKVDDVRENIVAVLQSLPRKKRPLRGPDELLSVAHEALIGLKDAMEELRMLVYIVRIERDGLDEKIDEASKMSIAELAPMDRDAFVHLLKSVP